MGFVESGDYYEASAAGERKKNSSYTQSAGALGAMLGLGFVLLLGSAEAQVILSISGGTSHTCARLNTGQAKCWGGSVDGETGLGTNSSVGDKPGQMGSSLASVSLGTGRTVKQLVAGKTHTCAILDNGLLKCWGLNTYGELGTADLISRGNSSGQMGDALPAISLSTNSTVTSVGVGSGHTCAVIKDTNRVKCWGYGFYGQLGSEGTANMGSSMGNNLAYVNLGTVAGSVAQVSLVVCGGDHSCARLTNGYLKCWGRNNYAQLGLGDQANRGDNLNEMGNNLPIVNLGVNRTVLSLAAGFAHNCAILDTYDLKCWGYNGFGQLGYGDNAIRGEVSTDLGDNLLPVNLGTGRYAIAITAGDYFTCAVLDNSRVKCWGQNNVGQLGSESTTPLGFTSGTIGDSLPYVNLGSISTVKLIGAGSNHVCVRLSSDALKCWGNNDYGQLGLGDKTIRGNAAGTMGDSLPTVAAVITSSPTVSPTRSPTKNPTKSDASRNSFLSFAVVSIICALTAVLF